jgi:hypothetical protein
MGNVQHSLVGSSHVNKGEKACNEQETFHVNALTGYSYATVVFRVLVKAIYLSPKVTFPACKDPTDKGHCIQGRGPQPIFFTASGD